MSERLSDWTRRDWVWRSAVLLALAALGAEPALAQDAAEATEAAAHAGWWSLLPALIAIAAALVFRQVIVALVAGVWVGAWIVSGELVAGAATGAIATINTYVLGALADADHAAIIVFSLMIGGLVGIIQKNGGTRGVVDIVLRWAKNAQRGQLATALLGTAVFFDDYANTLIVGGSMKPITDKLRISREKLAYLVDSTAAPIAALAFVTTWIGYEVGLIGTALEGIGYDEAAYSVFVRSLAYSFYPLLALFFVYLVAFTRRDFGPMLAAERRARESGAVVRADSAQALAEAEAHLLEPPEDAPHRAFNAIVPIAVLVVGVLVGLWVTGRASVLESGGDLTLQNIVGDANSYAAMMGASFVAVLVAVALSVGQRILSLSDAVEAWYQGLRSMLLAMVILVLAWSLSGVNDALGTAAYLVELLQGNVLPALLPSAIFLLAAATAFATGSSWGTMGILMPLVVPLAWGVLGGDIGAVPANLHVLYSSVACVLAGAVWGDHCSPISDTTILSSLASGCDHADHVRTQLPYALSVGAAALLLGTLPAGFGLPPWIGLLMGAGVLSGLLFWLGKPAENSLPL